MPKIAIFRHYRYSGVERRLPMNMNVSLTDELANFVKAKVSAGRYTS